MSKPRKRQGVMLAHTWDWNYEKIPPNIMVQPKLNGVRGLAHVSFDCGIVTSSIVSSTGLPFEFLATRTIQEQLMTLLRSLNTWNKNINSLFLDGEIYNHSMSFHEVSGKARRKNGPFPGEKKLQFHIFDLVDDLAFEDRSWVLANYFMHAKDKGLDTSNLKYVPTESIQRRQIIEYLNTYLEDGYEGIMIRVPKSLYEFKRSKGLLKYKPDQSISLEIVGIEPAISQEGVPYERVGKFLCYEQTPERNTTHYVAPGRLTHVELERLYHDPPIGKFLNIFYIDRTPDGLFVSGRGVNIDD